MDFAFTPEQDAIRVAIEKICAQFGDDYWFRKDHEGGFPTELHQALASAGWLGIAMPEQYGGSGLGITEASMGVAASNVVWVVVQFGDCVMLYRGSL